MECRFETRPCVLCCSPTAEDRIEHYARCPRVVAFASRCLGFSAASCSLQAFLLCEKGWSDEQLTARAVLVYAVFRCMHRLRNYDNPSESYVHDLLEQYAKYGVQGHGPSANVVFGAGRWRVMRHG